MNNTVKIVTVCFAAVMLICLIPAFSGDSDAAQGDFFQGDDGYWYRNLGNGEAEISSQSMAAGNPGASTYTGDFVVPSTVIFEGTTYTVIGIGAFAFTEAKITSISLPETLEYIEDGSFSNSTLTSITIPGSVTRIGMDANSPTTSGRHVFAYSNASQAPLAEVTFLAGTEPLTIGQGAFSNTALQSIELPDRTTIVRPYAF